MTENLQLEIEQACERWASELKLHRRDEESRIYHCVVPDFRRRVKYEDKNAPMSDTEAEAAISKVVHAWAYGGQTDR